MKIKDVSKFLNLSDQMIRYYEKSGVIKPNRTGSGNYREYSFMDVFMLFDALKYKEWNINIKDIADMVHNDYYRVLSQKIDCYIGETETEIAYKILLNNKLKNISYNLKMARYNIDNYWIEIVPEKVLFYSGVSKNEEYSDSQVPKKENEIILSSKYISFFDVFTEFNGDNNKWYYSIEKEDYINLRLDEYSYTKVLPERDCLCTIIDMGEAGNFNGKLLDPAYDYLNKKALQQIDTPFGIIIGRGFENGSFKRLMKIYIPIKTL